MSILQIERVASLQPHAIVLYKSFPATLRKEPGGVSLLNLEKGAAGEYNGYMSPATTRKVRKYLSNWLLSLQENAKNRAGKGIRYSPTFVTLTLPSPQQHDDNTVKRKLLDRFIGRVKQLFGVKYYFWRAEPQGQGNIHFHLIVDRWISWKQLRAEWNNILNDHGYISAYRAAQEAHHAGGFQVRAELLKTWPLVKQKAAYELGIKENWSNPNSTDIHKIENLDSLTAYVVKYVCKKAEREKDRAISGRIWGCSDEIRELGYYTDTHDIECNYQRHGNPEMTDYVAQVEQEVGESEVFEDEFIKVIRLKKPQAHYLEKFAPSLHKHYRNYYRSIYAELYEGHVNKLPLDAPIVEITPEPAPTLERFGPRIVQIHLPL